MPESSYKILLAKRLAVDPNALLNYFELGSFAIGTTPDGKQHAFSFYDLDHPKPAKEVAEKGILDLKKPSAADKTSAEPAKRVAKKKK